MKFAFLIFWFALSFNSSLAWATTDVEPLRIGVLASLSGFAEKHGTAVLEGAQLAEKELKKEGIAVELFIEDDQSQMKNTVTSFRKLLDVDRVQAVIAGTWWINSAVPIAERKNIPLFSAETVLANDTVFGKTYFILGGDLKDWIRIYQATVESQDLRRAAIVYASSGFAETIAEAYTDLFSTDGRTLVFSQQYATLDASDSIAKLPQLKQAKPDVIYIEGQPEGLIHVLRGLRKRHVTDVTILTNSIAETVLAEHADEFAGFRNVFYTTRADHSEKFKAAFLKHWKRVPLLNSDLAYYATHLAAEALSKRDPIEALRSGNLRFGDTQFTVDKKNVFHGVTQQIKRYHSGNSAEGAS